MHVERSRTGAAEVGRRHAVRFASRIVQGELLERANGTPSHGQDRHCVAALVLPGQAGTHIDTSTSIEHPSFYTLFEV